MNNEIKEFNEFINASKEAMSEKIQALVKDERGDEARPLRAALNIYDVFDALFNAAKNKAKGDKELFKTEFHKLATNVPANWRTSLEEAKKHNAIEKVLIEEAKLATAEEIIKQFDKLF